MLPFGSLEDRFQLAVAMMEDWHAQRALVPACERVEQVVHVTVSCSGSHQSVVAMAGTASEHKNLLPPSCHLSIAAGTLSHRPSQRVLHRFQPAHHHPARRGQAGIFGLAPISSTLLSNPCADPFPPADGAHHDFLQSRILPNTTPLSLAAPASLPPPLL
jgi:hypothetical protein